MADNKETSFLVGSVVGFHGLKGEIKVRPATNNPGLLLDIESVSICLPGERLLQATVKNVRLDKKLLFMSFSEYPDRTSVEGLLNAELFVEKVQLRALDKEEWWEKDLIGMEVFTVEGQFVGTVKGIVDMGSQLLEINTDIKDKTILVPFIKSLVPLVDLSKSRIEVVNIPGLLDPQ